MSIFGEAETFEVILSARDSGLTSGLARADEHVNRLTESAKRLAEAFLLFEGARKAVDFVKDISQAAASQQAAFKTVQVATTNAGENWRAYGKTVKETLVDQAKQHGFSVEQLAQGFVRLESVTKNSQKSFQLLGVAQDLSRARGIPLTTTTLALSKAIEGNTTSLARYGIVIPKVTTESDLLKQKHNELIAAHVKLTAAQKDTYTEAVKLAAAHDKEATALKAVKMVVGANAGQADAYGRTAAGAYDRAKVSIDEFEASLGRKLLPTEAAALQGLGNWVDGLQKSKRVQDDAKQTAEALADGFHAIVGAGETVGPILLDVANDVKAVVEAVGGVGPILAFGAAWYSLAKGVSTGARALQAVSKFSTLAPAGGLLPAAGTAGQTASRAAIVEHEAVTAQNLAVGASSVGSFGSSTGGFGASARATTTEAEEASKAISGIGMEAEKAGPSLAGFGAGMVGAFNPVTAAVIGVAALAGGLYYLSTQESSAEKGAKRTADAFDALTGSSNRFKTSTKNIANDKLSTSSDRISVRSASVAVDAAKQTLADPSLNRDALQHKENVLALAQAYNSWRLANHALQGDLALTKKDTGDQTKAERDHQEAISRTAHTLENQGNIARETGSKITKSFGASAGAQGLYNSQATAGQKAADNEAASLAGAAAAVNKFTEATNKQAAAHAKTNPALANASKLLGEYAQTQQRVPTKAEIEFVLKHAKADTDLATITSKLKNFNNKKSQAELGLAGYDNVFGKVTNLIVLLNGLNGKQVTIPIHYSTSGKPPSPSTGRTGLSPYRAASGMSISGAYGADDVPVWVTGSEAILNPKQISLVNSGMTVQNALSSTGAPTINRASSHAGGGSPAKDGSYADDIFHRKQGVWYLHDFGRGDVPLPMRRDISDFTGHYIGRGLSRAQVEYANDWWGEHFDGRFVTASSHQGGGNPITAFDNIPATATSTGKKKGTGKGSASASSSTSKTKVTPAQKAENAWQAASQAFDNSLQQPGLVYARDQANATTPKAQLARDLAALRDATTHKIAREQGFMARADIKGFANVVAEIKGTISGDYSTLGGYRTDLQDLLHPADVAPGADAFGKTIAGASGRLTRDQAVAGTFIPAPILGKNGKVKNAVEIAAATKRARNAKRDIKPTRNKLIALTQSRIAKLKAMRKDKKFKPLWGAILDEIDQDNGNLYGYISDKNNDQTTAAQDAIDAAQKKADDAKQAADDAAANKFDNGDFENQVTALNAVIAGDEAALAPGQDNSAALTTDTQRLFDLVGGRAADLRALIDSGSLPNDASTAAANDELTQDYGILSGITQGSTGAGGSTPGSSTATPAGVTADQAAQLAQVQQQLVAQTRATGLSEAAVRAFGSSGDIGSGGYANAYSSATGSGPTIVINTLHPGDPATLQAIGDAATAGQGFQTSIPSSRLTVNI